MDEFARIKRVIEDFTIQTLAAIPSDYGRLFYVSSLLNPRTGYYENQRLGSLYSADSIHEALTCCHEELISKILETPLREQEADLRKCFAGLGAPSSDSAKLWRGSEFVWKMCPSNLPAYLKNLFCSNVKVLLLVLSSVHPASATGA
jgi:hypothetical protein